LLPLPLPLAPPPPPPFELEPDELLEARFSSSPKTALLLLDRGERSGVAIRVDLEEEEGAARGAEVGGGTKEAAA